MLHSVEYSPLPPKHGVCYLHLDFKDGAFWSPEPKTQTGRAPAWDANLEKLWSATTTFEICHMGYAQQSHESRDVPVGLKVLNLL